MISRRCCRQIIQKTTRRPSSLATRPAIIPPTHHSLLAIVDLKHLFSTSTTTAIISTTSTSRGPNHVAVCQPAILPHPRPYASTWSTTCTPRWASPRPTRHRTHLLPQMTKVYRLTWISKGYRFFDFSIKANWSILGYELFLPKIKRPHRSLPLKTHPGPWPTPPPNRWRPKPTFWSARYRTWRT